jgi:ketosteroid isomerase-like protein
MNRITLAATAAVLALALSLAPSNTPATAGAADNDDSAKAVAVKALNAGAALFDAKDAKGLAETYTDDAVLTIVTRDKESGQIKKEVKNGRPDIEAYYQELFKSDSTYHSKNTVEYARWAGTGVLTIVGVFDFDTQSANSTKVPFVQTRVKQGEAWKIIDLQVFFLPDN